MYRRTRKFTWKTTVIDAFLGALKIVPGAALLTTPTLILYQTGPAVVPGMTLADYDECDFTGYAGVLLGTTLTGPVVTGGYDRALVSAGTYTGGSGLVAPGQTALGYLLTDGAAALYGGETFDDPVIFGAAYAFLNLDLILPLPPVYTPSVV